MRPQQKSRRGSSNAQSQAICRDPRSTSGQAQAHKTPSSRRATTGNAGTSEMGKRDKWIWLNVGGTYFLTSNPTLTRLTATNSPLYCLSTNSTNVPFDRDERGAFLIDRDPAYFSVLLNFLRHGHLLQAPHTTEEGLLLEAEYFNIPELQRLLKQRLQNRTLNHLINQKQQQQQQQQHQSSASALLDGQHAQHQHLPAGSNTAQLGLIGSSVNQLANQLAAGSARCISGGSGSGGGSIRGNSANPPGSGSVGLFNSLGLGPNLDPSGGYSGLLEV